MINVNSGKPPFVSYNGSDPYIFISYSHNDKEEVFNEIFELHNHGYRIWYDEGIQPGNSWPEEVAQALMNCTLFIVYISNNSILSKNVINEINFAINIKKEIIPIYITEVNLTPGLTLRIGDIQAIFKYDENYIRYFNKLISVISTRNPLLLVNKITIEEPRKIELDEKIKEIREKISGLMKDMPTQNIDDLDKYKEFYRTLGDYELPDYFIKAINSGNEESINDAQKKVYQLYINNQLKLKR